MIWYKALEENLLVVLVGTLAGIPRGFATYATRALAPVALRLTLSAAKSFCATWISASWMDLPTVITVMKGGVKQPHSNQDSNQGPPGVPRGPHPWAWSTTPTLDL